MQNTDRRLDLSAKFMQMGQTLLLEGKENKDYSISQIGTIMIFMSGLLLGEEEEIFKFSDLCSMFSAKKILDGLESDESPLKGIMKEMSGAQSYDEFIDRINELRKKNKRNRRN
jgi:hypothetical protein